MVLGALVGSVAAKTVGSALGSFLNKSSGSLGPAIGAFMTYEQNLKLMEKQQDWLEHMSNTAYQRQVEDLVKAGINPLYGLSGGASTPSSGLASAPDYASASSSGFQNKLASQLNEAQVHNLSTQSRLNDFNAVKTGYEGDVARQESESFDKRLNAQIALIGAQAKAALDSGSASSAQASYYRSLKLGQDLQNLGLAGSRENESQYYDWLSKHPFARWRSYNDRAGVLPGFNLSGGIHGSNYSNFGFKK